MGQQWRGFSRGHSCPPTSATFDRVAGVCQMRRGLVSGVRGGVWVFFLAAGTISARGSGNFQLESPSPPASAASPRVS